VVLSYCTPRAFSWAFLVVVVVVLFLVVVALFEEKKLTFFFNVFFAFFAFLPFSYRSVDNTWYFTLYPLQSGGT